jgi:putative oxidoreductase
MNSLSRFAEPAYCIMRLIIGLLLACHGGPKILGYPPGGHAAAETLDFVSGWIELAGGFLIAFGLFTRIAAFLSCGLMAVAYFMAHAPKGFYPINNGGERAVFYCFVFLYIFFRGGGRWSIDALMKRKSTPAVAPA